MKVSILVPIFGVEKYIERCSESLFNQTYQNIEYIFVNDCTPDASITILMDVLKRYPERLKNVIILNHDINKGLGCARNTAVENATGDFLMHVDSDDYLDVDCVRACVEKQLETNADIVTFDAIVYRDQYVEKRVLPDYNSPKELTLALMKREIPVNIWGRLIRRSLYFDNFIAVENGVNMSEDWNVIPRLSYYAKIISQIHTVFYHYDCCNHGSYTSSYSEKKYSQVWKTIGTLNEFFEKKEPIWTESLKFGIMKVISIQLLDVARTHQDKNSFHAIKTIQNKYDNKYCKHLDLGTRIALRISNYFFLCSYFSIASFAKQCIKRFQWSIH